jgi:hypothetical protein
VGLAGIPAGSSLPRPHLTSAPSQDLDGAAAASEGALGRSNPGEMMAERVVQAAAELASFVLPPELCVLAKLVSSVAAGVPDYAQWVRGLTPPGSAICQLWPSLDDIARFQQVRPKYVHCAIKAGAGSHDTREHHVTSFGAVWQVSSMLLLRCPLVGS